MLKKYLILIFILLFISLNCFANGNTSTKYDFSNNTIILPYYTHFYDYSSKNFNFVFLPISKLDYKKLTKQQQKAYKNFVKYDKYLQKGEFYKVKKADRLYMPAYLSAYYIYRNKGNYRNAVLELEMLKSIIRNEFKISQSPIIFDIDAHLVYDYYYNNDYYKTISTAKELLNIINEDSLKFFIASSYYNLNSYNDALIWVNKIKPNKNSYYYKQLLDLKYSINFRLNCYAEANKYAYLLYSYSYPNKYTASLRISATSLDNKIKLKYYDIAKKNAHNMVEISIINSLIWDIDEKLLNQALKTIKGFVKKPNWNEIVKKDIMDIYVENMRFDKFHKDITNCISNYKGNDLKYCLNSLNQEQNQISNRLFQEQQELNRQIAEQQRLQQLQMINNNLQYQNTLLMQQNYELNRPRTYNSTTNQVGNYSYTTTTSY